MSKIIFESILSINVPLEDLLWRTDFLCLSSDRCIFTPPMIRIFSEGSVKMCPMEPIER